MEQHGQLAVVTGGASGIGLALAKAYAQRGFRLLVVDVNPVALALAVTDLASLDGDVKAACIDLTVEDAADRLAAAIEDQGPIGAVCMNAGVTSSGSTVWDTPARLLNSVLAVNLGGLHATISGIVPTLVKQGSEAEILITASMAGMVTSGWSGAYAASKAGAIALAKALRQELQVEAPLIKVALLNPGMVRTDLIRTSAANVTDNAGMTDDLVRAFHDSLNEAGVEPDVVAKWSMEALANNEFWVLPPADDMFSGLLAGELAELAAAQRA